VRLPRKTSNHAGPFAHQIPMHRLGTPDQVAKIIYELCGEMSCYVNGVEFTSTAGDGC
jgi:hypothetical protein